MTYTPIFGLYFNIILSISYSLLYFILLALAYHIQTTVLGSVIPFTLVIKSPFKTIPCLFVFLVSIYNFLGFITHFLMLYCITVTVSQCDTKKILKLKEPQNKISFLIIRTSTSVFNLIYMCLF